MGNLCPHFSFRKSLSKSNSQNNVRNDSTAFNPKAELTRKGETVNNALITGKGESVTLGVEDSNEDSAPQSNEPKVILLPHQHTLFCERKVSFLCFCLCCFIGIVS
jgi:hypothetical protein